MVYRVNLRRFIQSNDLSRINTSSVGDASYEMVLRMRCAISWDLPSPAKMSDWLTRDHVTLPNSKWWQYLHRLFIPVERRLIAA